jgi:hypothetical protein
MARSSQDRQRFVGDLGHSRLVTSITGSWRSGEGVAGQAGWAAQLDLVAGVGVAVVQRRLGPAPRPRPPQPSGRCHPRRSNSAAGAGPGPPPGCPWPATARRARPGPATRPRRRTTPPAPGRPHDQEALVFTAATGGPLSRAHFVKLHVRPAIQAANEAIAKLPKDRRPAPCRSGCGSTTYGTPTPACSSPRARASRPSRRSSGMRPRASPSTPTGTCSRPRWTPSGIAWSWSGTRLGRTQHAPADNGLGGTTGPGCGGG